MVCNGEVLLRSWVSPCPWELLSMPRRDLRFLNGTYFNANKLLPSLLASLPESPSVVMFKRLLELAASSCAGPRSTSEEKAGRTKAEERDPSKEEKGTF